MTTALLAFLPVAVTLVLVPGVNNLVVLRETVASGRGGGFAAIAGTSIGILAWSGAVALGLGAVAAEHPHAFTRLQVVGAGLLVAGGIRSAAKALRRPKAVGGQVYPPEGQVVEPRGFGPRSSDRRGGRGASFRSAAVTSLANPRCPVTAVSVLPQFVAPGSAGAATTLALGVLWTVVAGLWNVVGVLLAHRGRGVLTRPAARRAVEGVSAVALVADGVSLATAV